MARVKIPNQGDGSPVQLYDGDKVTQYLVANGEVVVDDAHVEALIVSVPGSALIEEEPKTKVAKPAKE